MIVPLTPSREASTNEDAPQCAKTASWRNSSWMARSNWKDLPNRMSGSYKTQIKIIFSKCKHQREAFTGLASLLTDSHSLRMPKRLQALRGSQRYFWGRGTASLPFRHETFRSEEEVSCGHKRGCSRGAAPPNQDSFGDQTVPLIQWSLGILTQLHGLVLMTFFFFH